MKTTFYFNTGVRAYNSTYMEPNDIRNEHGERLIPFDCENVPEGCVLVHLCDKPTQSEKENCIVRETFNTTLSSIYAVFTMPTNYDKLRANYGKMTNLVTEYENSVKESAATYIIEQIEKVKTHGRDYYVLTDKTKVIFSGSLKEVERFAAKRNIQDKIHIRK